MPPAKRSTTKRRTTTRKKPAARKSPASKEPAAVARLNKALDSAQDALNALRKDLSKGRRLERQGPLQGPREARPRRSPRQRQARQGPSEGPREVPEAARRRRQAGAARLQRQAQAGVSLQGKARHAKRRCNGEAHHAKAPTAAEPRPAHRSVDRRERSSSGSRVALRRRSRVQFWRVFTAISAPDRGDADRTKHDPLGPGVQVEDRGIGEHQQDEDEDDRQDRDVRPLACELLLWVSSSVGVRT